MKRFVLIATLSLLCALSLWAAAGPAAAVTPPGSQWGGHEVNAWAWIINIDKYVTLQVVADDERVSGLMDVSIRDTWYDADGVGHQSGTFTLYNDAGSWRCPYWEILYYFNARSAEYPVQEVELNCTATGSGAYKGLIFVSAHHATSRSMFITKGWILPAD